MPYDEEMDRALHEKGLKFEDGRWHLDGKLLLTGDDVEIRWSDDGPWHPGKIEFARYGMNEYCVKSPTLPEGPETYERLVDVKQIRRMD